MESPNFKGSTDILADSFRKGTEETGILSSRSTSSGFILKI